MNQLDPHVELLKRQVCQMVRPEDLILPPPDTLRLPEIQAQIYDSMFREDVIKFPISHRYKSRVLKLLVKALEESIQNPDEDEISDDLTSCLAETFARPTVSDGDDAQRKVYVTYSAPDSLDVPGRTITTLESPALLAAAGTTGLRTWGAAKFLASYLCTQGRDDITGKNIIELGAGTGVVSMFCVSHLHARFVLATDGTGEVVDDVVANMFLNNLDKRDCMDAVVLKWGHFVTRELVLDEEEIRRYDLVLGADIIFDDRLILPLVATLHQLFGMYPSMDGLIATTIRKQETVDKFLKACAHRGLSVAVIASSLGQQGEEQTGLFHALEPEIKIFKLTRGLS